MGVWVRMFFLAAWLGIAGLATAATPSQASGEETDIAAIKALSQEVTEAYIARDWDLFAGYFTEDAIWMPNNVPPLAGKSEWWSFVEPFWHGSEIVKMSLVSEEIVIMGDWAFERHTEEQVSRAVSGEGELATYRFKGIWLLRRQADGGWKIKRYIWNFNPAPDPTP